jgi:hypothetical protein
LRGVNEYLENTALTLTLMGICVCFSCDLPSMMLSTMSDSFFEVFSFNSFCDWNFTVIDFSSFG